MSSFLKFVGYFSIIPLLIGLFFFSNFKGYYRFKNYCANEGGLRVYEQLNRDAGWWAESRYDAQVVAQLKYVEFVRYIDKKDGNAYDLRYVGGNPQRDSSFESIPSDVKKQIKYKWVRIRDDIEDEIRLKKFGHQVLDAASDKILVSYYVLRYEIFDSQHLPLEVATMRFCPLLTDAWVFDINSAFKN